MPQAEELDSRRDRPRGEGVTAGVRASVFDARGA